MILLLINIIIFLVGYYLGHTLLSLQHRGTLLVIDYQLCQLKDSIDAVTYNPTEANVKALAEITSKVLRKNTDK